MHENTNSPATTNETVWLTPDWPAPAWIKAGTSTRLGGVSPAPYDSLNLGDHVGDALQNVMQNRQRLMQAQHFPSSPVWLNQVHGIQIVDAASVDDKCPDADGSFTTQTNIVCAAMTADCLPVLFCNHEGSVVAAAHAGWRGLADGVLEACVDAMGERPGQLMTWLGPAIGPQAFEVGDEVRAEFIKHHKQAEQAFTPSNTGGAGHWMADIYQLARIRLNRIGINSIYGGHWCTYNDKQRFFSYRRDGVTGRMASFIWIENS